jgi:hypothetical protein
MIDTLQCAVHPKGKAQDVVVGDTADRYPAGITTAQASVVAPPARAVEAGRPGPHGSLAADRAPRPWVASAQGAANRC